MLIERDELQKILESIPEGGAVDLQLQATDIQAPETWSERAELRVRVRQLEERAVELRGQMNSTVISLHDLITEDSLAVAHRLAGVVRERLLAALERDSEAFPHAE